MWKGSPSSLRGGLLGGVALRPTPPPLSFFEFSVGFLAFSIHFLAFSLVELLFSTACPRRVSGVAL